MLFSDTVVETIENLAHELRRANRNDDRIEARFLFRRLISEGQGGVLLVPRLPPKKSKKLERCKVWLAGLLGTVPRTIRFIHWEARQNDVSFSSRTIRRALKELGAVYIYTGYRKQRRISVCLPKEAANMLAEIRKLADIKPGNEIDLPTLHLPGTEDRLKIYEERAAAGLPVQHPADAKLPDKAGFTAELHPNHELKGRRLHEPKRPA